MAAWTEQGQNAEELCFWPALILPLQRPTSLSKKNPWGQILRPKPKLLDTWQMSLCRWQWTPCSRVLQTQGANLEDLQLGWLFNFERLLKKSWTVCNRYCIWPVNPKIFTERPFTDTICWPLWGPSDSRKDRDSSILLIQECLCPHRRWQEK